MTVRLADVNEQRRGFRRMVALEFQPHVRTPDPARSPLTGVPFAVKENIDIGGFPTQAGLGTAPPPADADAPCVARLRAAGAVLVGQTAMDEAALGSSNDNPHYGRTMNPRRAGYTPGGSSGGSAVAVASGAVRFALGTDTLGSVRIPAAYCGIVGFKPSFDRVPSIGVKRLAPSLDHVGVLAESVDMAAAAFDAMAQDARKLDTPSRAVIGVPDSLSAVDLEPAVHNAFERALKTLRERGDTVRVVPTPGWIPVTARKAAFLLIEVEAAAVYLKWLDDPQAPLSARLKEFLRYGRDCSPERLAGARAEVSRCRVAIEEALAEVDVLALPTCPQVAFPFEMKTPLNQAELTTPANLAGAPAISIPIPAEDLPIGFQLMAARGTDERLLAIAARTASAFGAA